MENSSEARSGVRQMRKEIAIVAGPKDWGDTRESWLSRVPRAVKKALGTDKETITYRTVKSLWYGEINESDHWAARDIRRAAGIIEARREAAALASQYQQIVSNARAKGEGSFSEEIARLEQLARIISGQASTRDTGVGE